MKSSDYHYVERRGCIPLRNALIVFIIICFSLTFPGMAFVPTASATVPTVNTVELAMGEEALPIYSKEDLQNILNDIRGKLDAYFPVTTELIFLEDIRNELKRQLTEVEMKIEEDLAAMPDVPGEEFNTDFDAILDDIKRMIYMLDDIIISPSIEDIDAVLELMETLDQELQDDILAARMDVPDKATFVRGKSQPLDYIETTVTDENLAETDEIVFTERIRAKAAELRDNFVHMVSWVTLNVKNEVYPGSMKTADEVLVDGAGNALDICTLLITFFRINNTPAKYIKGYKDLTPEQFMNWTGTSTIEAAIEVIEGNNNPPVIHLDDGRIRIEHVYVAFYGPNKQWAVVDPAFKEYIKIPGSGFAVDQEAMDTFIAAIDLDEDATTYLIDYAVAENVIEAQTAVYNSTVNHIDEVIGTREILATQKIVPPIYLSRGILPSENFIEEFSAIPSHLQVKFMVEMTYPFWWWNVTDFRYITPMSRIAGKRISIYYEPADPETYNAKVEEYGSIYDVPNSRFFWMNPVLEIDGDIVARGSSRLLTSYQKVYTGFWMPGTGATYQNKEIRAGNKYDLSIPTQETSMEELKRLAEELQKKIAESELGPDDIVTDDMILERLRLAGMFYFAAKGALSEKIARRLNIVVTNHMSIGYVCDEIKAAPGYMIKKAGVHIDVVRNSIKAISASGNEDDVINYRASAGWLSTAMESAMIDLAFRTTKHVPSIAVSTAVIFVEASKQGVPIHKIRPEHLSADLAGITWANFSTLNHIKEYVGTYGYTAFIPQRPIMLTTETGTQWYGDGWQVVNPVTGSAGYMICGGPVYGGMVEDVQVINGGSSANIVEHPLSVVELLLHTLIIGGGPISSGLGHMMAADYIYSLAVSSAGIIRIVPLILGFQVIGVALIIAGIAGFITVYGSFWPSGACFKRRREYAYV